MPSAPYQARHFLLLLPVKEHPAIFQKIISFDQESIMAGSIIVRKEETGSAGMVAGRFRSLPIVYLFASA
jgi:hypothetical protein